MVETEAYAGVRFTSDLEADESVTDILRVVGMSENFQIHAPDVPNAAASIRNGVRLLLHSPAFMGHFRDS